VRWLVTMDFSGDVSVVSRHNFLELKPVIEMVRQRAFSDSVMGDLHLLLAHSESESDCCIDKVHDSEDETDAGSGYGGCTDCTSDGEDVSPDEMKPIGGAPPGVHLPSTSYSRQTFPVVRNQMSSGLEGKRLTTVMLRNLPNNINRDLLMEIFNSNGFEGCYNFLYLPIDFVRHANLGYVFVNLIDEETAAKFWIVFNGFKGWKGPSQKVCEVLWSTPCQGLDEHIARYRDSPMMHAAVPDSCRPILLKDGERIPFPAPTKSLRQPRFRMPPTKRPFWRKDDEQ